MSQTMKAGQYLTLNLRASEPQDNGMLRISGVANDADVTDTFNTRITVTQRALDNFMSNSVMLLNHDVNNPVGRFTKVEYRGKQLYVEGEVDPDARTNTGANVADLCRKGILRAFSIRFDEYKEQRTKDFTQIEADALDEISIVTLPSNKASLFQMRSQGIELHGAEELIDEQAAEDAPEVEAAEPEVTEAEPERQAAPFMRLHPDDLAEIVRQVRQAVTPEPESSVSDAPLETAPQEAEVETVNLEDVRSALRSVINEVSSAPVA